MAADHKHRLQECHDCTDPGYGPCDTCHGRGYLRPEFCSLCSEPMGNSRRRWKREGKPATDGMVALAASTARWARR